MEILAVVGFILAIVGGGLALLLPRDYLNFAVLCVALGAAFLGAEMIW